MKNWLALICAFFLASAAYGQTAALQGYCDKGGTKSVTSGLSSSNYSQGDNPHCTITVYLTGTTTLATIYADKDSTPLANPFTANTVTSQLPGKWIFWAAVNQGYDVIASGGDAPNTYPAPVPICADCYPNSQFISPTGGGCSAGGIPTTNGLVDGDNTSTNCGYQNRTGDTASVPAENQTFGYQLLQNNSGTDNVAMGWSSGGNNTGSINVFIGDSAGLQNVGDVQVFIGNSAGQNNTGDTVVGVGENAGRNSSATFSDFIGDNAGYITQTSGWDVGQHWECMGYDSCQNGIALTGSLGNYNIGIGAFSAGDVEGDYNVALGYAGGGYHTGHDVIAIGQGAGDGRYNDSSTPTAGNFIIALGNGSGAGSGSQIVAIGDDAVRGPDSAGGRLTNAGDEVIGIGDHSLTANQTGTGNVGIGQYAGSVGWVNYLTPGFANLSGSHNTWIGDFSGPGTTTQLSNTIALGYQATNDASNQTVIGNSSITSLKLFGCPSGQAVLTDGSGTCYTPGAGSGTVTGSGTTGYLPKWTGSTALGDSALDDGVTTASTLTAHEKVAISSASDPSQVTMTYNVGHAPTGTAGSAVWAPDTSGNATVSENNAAFSRVCTVLNGLCSGGGGSAENTVTITGGAMTLSASAALNTVTFNASITTITFANPTSANTVCVDFVHDATATAYTVAWPANVLGGFVPGSTASKNNTQCFVGSPSQSKWVATGTGDINE